MHFRDVSHDSKSLLVSTSGKYRVHPCYVLNKPCKKVNKKIKQDHQQPYFKDNDKNQGSLCKKRHLFLSYEFV